MSEDLTVLIVGAGAREHVISHLHERSSQVRKIIISPGNDLISYNRDKEIIVDPNSDLKDPQTILNIAKKYKPDRIEVAQDDAIALGTVDLLKERGYNVFGPSQKAAKIESSKVWSRQFMARHEIPSPGWQAFDDSNKAKANLQYQYTVGNPNAVFFVKADGLAMGKGAIGVGNVSEAFDAIDRMSGFGESGKKFLVEEGMDGEEFSCYAIVDKNGSFHVFKSAQDNKRVFDGDQGPNTGGMGAISPAMVTRGSENEIESEMISKAIRGLGKEGRPFVGVLYLGGIKTVNGLKVIEYNARWGDPEAQVVMPGILNDYMTIVDSCITGTLDKLIIKEDDKTRVCIVGVSKGYPGDYSIINGKRIFGLEEVVKMPEILVFGAGIKIIDKKFYANGGRLFNIVAEGENIIQARERANEAMSLISIEGDNLHYRKDIGLRDELRFRNKD